MEYYICPTKAKLSQRSLNMCSQIKAVALHHLMHFIDTAMFWYPHVMWCDDGDWKGPLLIKHRVFFRLFYAIWAYDPSVELWRVICDSCGRIKIWFKIFGPLSYFKQRVKILVVKNGEALWLLGVKCGPLWDWCWCHQLENTHSNMQSGSWGGATFILLLNHIKITYKRSTQLL